jgi:hypothetical protein
MVIRINAIITTAKGERTSTPPLVAASAASIFAAMPPRPCRKTPYMRTSAFSHLHIIRGSHFSLQLCISTSVASRMASRPP